MSFIQIISVKSIEKYKLQVSFADGLEGIYDAGHLAQKGVFKAWDVDNNFKKVFINPDSGAITWPGDLDIDSIKVYTGIKGINSDYFLNDQKHATYL